jgi:ABC-type transport system involved in multi-copper enzyme maturation permease subunit
VLFAVLGVLVISGEYRTGMIRTTLLAVPVRSRMLTGKIVAFTGLALVTSLILSFVTFFVGQWILGDFGTTLGEPEVLRAVIGSALYITASGLFGVALGTLIRHTPGAIVAVLSMLYLLPQMTSLLPGEWGTAVHRHFTTNAGQQIALVQIREGQLTPWAGFGVYCLWVAVPMIVALVLLNRRDA